MADRLNEILKNTMNAIETGKEEIFYISEMTRTEILRLSQELSQLRLDLGQTIIDVDKQYREERRARQKLMEVNRDYKGHSEEEMIKAYENAKNCQVKLQLLQAKEVQLRTRRDEIERSLKQMGQTIERAENLMAQVNMAISLLQGGISELSIPLTAEQKQEIGVRIIKAQEEERRRVAREIHDGPAQTLANIVLRLEITDKLLDIDADRARAEIKDLKRLVRSNLQDIRRIIFDLRPLDLEDLGLVAAMEKYLENFEAKCDVHVELRIEGEAVRLPSALELALFRLIEECLNNVAKHSRSVRARLEIRFGPEWINIRIIDYGQGFDVTEIFDKPGEHFGLIGIKERVDLFSGRFSLRSSPGKGTTVEFGFRSEGGAFL
ncbi:Two component system, signal transduction histidine kinase [Acididesulfobacillus acetoxydans]|uniref:histidine kinase n=1 Tax=Acididesulfobacillus acetoxydans TaxID=1561005 RepID=A0A8S0X5Q2_9FIRM|nr:sensor histidine kinase [Acididesulfobacillus acetoxydans]CAA7601850.1 Two component system, signal transduction histidine kinase [Acididesulfobacillus acetoxydans]CEJ08675.1 Signal transduction histidine-protein kinase/phosphatase DegS [Acididesulfobacillus acetoxydans]